MGNGDNCSVEYAQREKANLAVIEIIQKSKRINCEDSFDCEIVEPGRLILDRRLASSHSNRINSVVTSCSDVKRLEGGMNPWQRAMILAVLSGSSSATWDYYLRTNAASQDSSDLRADRRKGFQE